MGQTQAHSVKMERQMSDLHSQGEHRSEKTHKSPITVIVGVLLRQKENPFHILAFVRQKTSSSRLISICASGRVHVSFLHTLGFTICEKASSHNSLRFHRQTHTNGVVRYVEAIKRGPLNRRQR